MGQRTRLSDFTIMNPPARILPEDYEMIKQASFLMDLFATAASMELGELGEEIMDAMTDAESEQVQKVIDRIKVKAVETEGDHALRMAYNLYVSDICILATSRFIPEKKLIRLVPTELASHEMADAVQRYDMFTTASLIRLAIR